ncbi:MAG: cytochrome c [Alphaproteobacteria bacterium]|nr:cytochrome c [Alphaproteobacteria bacterium]
MGHRAPSAWAAPVLIWAALASGAAAQTDGSADAVARGKYVFHAAGCFGCHTDVKGKGAPLAGGRALVTPFGTFFGPNITPDPAHGIGGWTLTDFTRALRTGVAPDGRSYYPAFPFTSFTGMTDADIADLWAYLRTVGPVPREDDAHRLNFPFGWRWLNGVWKALYFVPAPFEPGEPPDGVEDRESWRRGAYLVSALSHCGECHSPRGALGAMRRDYLLGGNPAGPDGKPVPNITPHPKRGIGRWSAGDIATYLKIGMDRDGDFAGGAMAEVIEHTTGKLTQEDRAAIAAYLRALPPVDRAPTRPAAPPGGQS